MRALTTHRAVTAIAVLTLARAAAAQDARPPLRVAASAELNGEVAPPRCGTDDATAPSGLHALAAQFAGEPDALALDAGNLLGSGAIARVSVDRDPDALAQAIAATGVRTLALGHNDLAAPRDTLLRVARALAARDRHYVLTNLHCDPAARALCDAVIDADDPPALVTTPAGRVAVLSALAPAWLANVARDRAAGVTLEAVLPALTRGVERARAAGAEWIVVSFDPDAGDPLRDATQLADGLATTARPDLLLVNGLSDRVGALWSAGGVRVVATRPGAVVAATSSGDTAPRVAPAGTAPEEVTRYVTETSAWLCATLSQPLPGGRLAGPMQGAGFADVLLDVLRETAHADVAAINRGALDFVSSFPARGALTRLAVVSAMPFDNYLRVAGVRGSALRTLVTSPRAATFFFRGITVRGGDVRINGRTVLDTAVYRVVTTDYVAEGGDGGLGVARERFRPYGLASTRDALLAWLTRPRTAALASDALDLTQRTRWTLRWTVDAALTATTVANPDRTAYVDPQVARSTSVTGRLDTEFRADADHPTYTFDNSLRLRYGFSRTTAPDGTDTGFVESTDLVTARSTYTYRGTYRGLLSHAPPWYAPLPYAEVYTETELSCPCPPDGMEGRRYHHLQLRPTVGPRFEFSEHFSLFAGFGLDWEVFQPGGSVVPVVIGGWTLRPWRMFTIEDRPVEAESTLEATWRDPGGAPDALLRFRAKLSIPLFDPLALTVTYDLFARLNSGQNDWAIANDVTVGLKVTYTRALQAFVF